MAARAHLADSGEGTPSLAAIYREHHAFVWNSIRRLGLPTDGVDDAVQDVFVVVARRLADFRGDSSIRTWLFAIGVRVVQHHRRSMGRHDRRVEALRRAQDWLVQDPDMERHDAAALLRTLLDTLDEGKRTVYILMELEQMTAPEVGAILGLKVPTVHSRLRLARAALRTTVEQLRAREEGDR